MCKQLTAQGMAFNELAPDAFCQVLIKSGFYDTWKAKYGAKARTVLEKYTGKVGAGAFATSPSRSKKREAASSVRARVVAWTSATFPRSTRPRCCAI